MACLSNKDYNNSKKIVGVKNYQRIDSGVVEKELDLPSKRILGRVPQPRPVLRDGHVTLDETNAKKDQMF